jgi:hypothetical protein
MLGLPLPPRTTVPPPMGGMPPLPGMPGTMPQLPTAPSLTQQPTAPTMVGGILQLAGAALVAAEEAKRAADTAQQQPVIQGLAGHVRQCWTMARTAREQTVELRMFKSIRQRRGEYEPDRLAVIRQQGGSEIYLQLTSAKCRGAAAWLRDVLLGSGTEKPWTLKPTPQPTLPPDIMAELRQRAIDELSLYMQITGEQVPPTELRKFLAGLREEFYNDLYEEARRKTDNMERKMEDQMVEGDFPDALDAFIDDLTTFPAAILKGPVIRNRLKMTWEQTPAAPPAIAPPGTASGAPVAQQGWEPVLKETLSLEWERVDPLMAYPSPTSAGVDDGYFIERHKLRQQDLEALIGVPGYDEGAIRGVLEDYGRGGMQEWLIVDSSKASAEGKSTTQIMQNPEHTIDALQFWGMVSGQMLRDWGLKEDEVPDTAKNYPAECWLIGRWVIKAVLNADPLGRKPYYKASYEDIPGCFWGNSVCDLVRDCQDMCNAAGRAIANNTGIASGPQVAVNVERLPPGEDIESMFPWKIWQHTCDPMGSTADAVHFFQPQSIAGELMQIYEKFAVLADEYSAIPRYMTGDSPAGGAGRTASGMSMLMTNANKSMKQVVGNIDHSVITPMLERLYYYNMKFSDDPGLKGDVQVVARGAASVVAKESAQVRRNEFLSVIGSNPAFMQVIGQDGISALLREAAKTLDMNPDDVVPPAFKTSLAKQMAIRQQQMAPPPPPELQQGAEGASMGPPGSGANPPRPVRNRQTLDNLAPTTDHFSPSPNP